jgi:hypothetical protein
MITPKRLHLVGDIWLTRSLYNHETTCQICGKESFCYTWNCEKLKIKKIICRWHNAEEIKKVFQEVIEIRGKQEELF